MTDSLGKLLAAAFNITDEGKVRAFDTAVDMKLRKVARDTVADAYSATLEGFVHRNADNHDNPLHGAMINSPESKRRYGTMKTFAEWKADQV